MFRLLGMLLFLSCLTRAATASDGFIEKYKLSLFAGSRYMSADSLSLSENLDFVNCFEKQTGGLECLYLGISLDLWLKGNWETGISLLMQDGIAPSNYNLAVRYMPFKYLGFNMGIYGYSYFIEEFNYMFQFSDPQLIVVHDDNYFQMVAKEFSFIAGPVLRFNKGLFHTNLTLNTGVIMTRSYNQMFAQKQIGSNYRRVLIYETQPSWAFLSFPEIKISYDAFKFENLVLGFQVHSNFLYQKKQIDYLLTVIEWTEEKMTTHKVNNPKHTLKKCEIGFGLYYQW